MKYSVLMSVYEKEKEEFLEKSLTSMVTQSFEPEEIIIVIDGPIRTSLFNVINEVRKNTSVNIIPIQLEENYGLGHALDVGLTYCSNELIARMDSDDISKKDRCEKQIKKFYNNDELVIVGSHVEEFYDDPQKIVSSRNVPTEYLGIKKYIKRRSPFNHPSVMYKKSKVLSVGGYRSLKKKQDYDLFSRMINNEMLAENIDEPLVLFRSNEDNFKRRKSYKYCKSYIDVQIEIWKRGHCSIFDLMFVIAAQIFIFIAPLKFFKVLSNLFLRN